MTTIAPTDLTIPVYLDNVALVDLLATLEDGLSMVADVKVSTRMGTTSTGHLDVEGGGGVQVAQVINLLKLGLKGSGDHTAENAHDEEHVRHVIHTHGSLFNRLRNRLRNDGGLIEVEQQGRWTSVRPGAMVEVSGLFRLNPLVSAIGVFRQVAWLMDYMEQAGLVQPGGQTEEVASGPRRGRNGKGGQGLQQAPSRTKTIMQTLDLLLADLRNDNVHLYVVDAPGRKLVVPVLPGNIRDAGFDLHGGDYTVLGKVFRMVDDPAESVSLLPAGSALGLIPDSMMEPVYQQIEEMGMKGLKVDVPKPSVPGPVALVLPVAIYR